MDTSFPLHTLSILYNDLVWIINSREPAVAYYDRFMMSKWGGIISIVISAHLFGTFGIFCKTKAMQRVKMDPVIFQFLFTLAVCGSNAFLLLYLPFRFDLWGFFSGVLKEPASIFSISAIVFLSLSLSQSIKAVALSFVVGVILGEPVGNWFFSLFALILILVLLVALAVLPFLEMTPVVMYIIRRIIALIRGKKVKETSQLQEMNNELTEVTELLGINHDSVAELSRKEKVKIFILEQRRPLLGVLFSILCGYLDVLMSSSFAYNFFLCRTLNALMILPVKASPPKERGIPLIYSNGLGIVFTSTIIVILYIIVRKLKTGRTPSWHLDVAMRPALLSGLIWNIGNYFSLYATLSPLGMTGFALTQFAILVAGSNGIILYREIRDPISIIIYFVIAVLLIFSGVLLAEFGPSG